MTFTWSKNSVLADMARRAAEAHRNPPATEAPTNATLAITDSKLYVLYQLKMIINY